MLQKRTPLISYVNISLPKESAYNQLEPFEYKVTREENTEEMQQKVQSSDTFPFQLVRNPQ